jgi:porphobilinogen synthase
MFPNTRLRRLRYNPVVRSLVAETTVGLDDIIQPIFVKHGHEQPTQVKSMPGVFQLNVDDAVAECELLFSLGIQSVLLFGIPEHKDEHGHVACLATGIVQRATRAIKHRIPQMLVVVDVCNCEYTTHGHCGTIVEGDVDNDLTLETLALQAVSLAGAGADVIAPSDMMDGRVRRIREALDAAGFMKIPIMSYSAKYSSGFYGPFRDAAGSAPQFGDRRTYQMNPANSNEAIREIELDIAEGADIIMVKPALSYLDIIRRAKDTFKVPIAAYNVSGEYSMVKAAAANGWIDEQRVILEILTSIKRAGADIIITYFGKDLAKALSHP